MAEGTHHARLVAGPLRLAQEGSGALLDQSNVVPKIQRAG